MPRVKRLFDDFDSVNFVHRNERKFVARDRYIGKGVWPLLAARWPQKLPPLLVRCLPATDRPRPAKLTGQIGHTVSGQIERDVEVLLKASGDPTKCLLRRDMILIHHPP